MLLWQALRYAALVPGMVSTGQSHGAAEGPQARSQKAHENTGGVSRSFGQMAAFPRLYRRRVARIGITTEAPWGLRWLRVLRG